MRNLLGNILDHGVSGNFNVLGESFIEGLAQLGKNVRCTHAPVQDSAGGVRGSVGASDQLGESFGSEFGEFELVTVAVLAFHQAGEQVDTSVVGHDLGLDTLVDTGDSNTSQVLNGFHAFAEETVGNPLGEGNERRHATQSSGDLATTVQNLNGSDILGRILGVLAHLSNILTLVEHTEGSTESKITNDIESKEVEPVEGIKASISGLGVTLQVRHLLPLLHELLDVAMNVLLELSNGLGTECMGDGLALAGVLGTVTGVEQTTANRDKGIVEVTGICLARGSSSKSC